MSYRPICDVMILARSKTKYYGAYPAGFLSRGRDMLGVHINDCVLHVCAGKVREYPFAGLGPMDVTVDIDPMTGPDYCLDVRHELPSGTAHGGWKGIMIDRPYTPEDADHYATGRDTLPDINDLLKRCLDLIEPGRRVGVLDYIWPHPGKLAKEVFVTAVGTGRNGRARWYVVFEKLAAPQETEDVETGN